jgi:hypothetical protein
MVSLQIAAIKFVVFEFGNLSLRPWYTTKNVNEYGKAIIS